MRHFRLKRTITHATVLSALFPTGMALSHQVQIPIGLASKITIAASASALLGHQVTPAGLAPMDPQNAPARGGYVYDAFNRVVRTGVTGECVKHGFWSPELATPNCEPWLFATPAPKAAEPEPKAAEPAPKAEEGFPEWIGPDEFRVGVVPVWPENEFTEPDNIGLPRMYFDDAGDDQDEQVDDLISAPILYGEQSEYEGDERDLVSASIVYYDEDEGNAAADELISAPRYFADEPDAGAAFEAGQWPADPYAAGIPDEEPAVEESNDQWMPSDDERVAAPASGIMEFKEEGVWPANPYPGEYVEDQEVTASDDSWVIPNPLPQPDAGEAVMAYEEDGKDPEEAISNPIMYFDTEDQGVVPPEDIIGHTLVQTEDDGEGATVPDDHIIGHTLLQTEDDGEGPTVPDDHIIGHSIYHPDGSDNAVGATDDLIGTPRVYEMTEEPAAGAAAPYDGSEFSNQPFPEPVAEDEPEGEPFNAQFPPAAGAPGPVQEDAPPPVQITDSGLAWQPDAEEDEDEVQEDAGDYQPDYSSTLAARDAGADLPYPPTPAPAAVDTQPPYGPAEEEEEVQEEPYVPDYSNVPTAKNALDDLPAATTAAAPAAEQPPAPAKEEEHLMTVVLSADALFEFDRYAVRKGGNKSLREFADAVKQIQWGQILVVGHTDRLGSDKYNQRLSERRAQTVRRELMKLGLDGKKIKAVGKGKTEPITKDCVGNKRSKALIECLQPDRRVEIFVDEKQQIIIKKAPGKK